MSRIFTPSPAARRALQRARTTERARRMPYRHTLIFDDSLNMLWKAYADRAAVDYRFNSTVKGSARGCAAAMRIALQARGSLRLHTDLAFRSDHAAMSVQFWVRGLSAQFDGSRCDSTGAASARRYIRPARPSGWHCAGAVCLALWRSWGGQSVVQMVPLCSLAQVDRHGWHKVSVPASAFAPSFGEAFDEVVFLAGATPAELLIDELVVVSSAAPPRGPASSARAPPRDAAGSPGWCEYLSSEFDRDGRHAAHSGAGQAQGGGGGGTTRGGGARRGATRGSGVGGVHRARAGGARGGDARGGGLRQTRRGRGRGRRMLGSSPARSRAAGGGGGARRGGGAGRAEAGRALAAAGPITPPLCRVLDGDHLQGRWVQNCEPQSISRPDRYAYGHTLPGSAGTWDYRQCFKMSYEERERSRAALSWSWQPRGCRLRRVEGGAFSAWLGARTLP